MSWIFYTITAAVLQTFRNLEQKALSKKLDALTVSWSRFILPFPFAIFVVFVTFSKVDNQFITYSFITSVAQVLGNISLIQAFKKNFSIGIAFCKTEVLQTLILGLLLFNQTISSIGVLAIIATTIGAILMSGSFDGGIKKFFKSLNNQSTIFGLFCGLCFSISAFNLKLATEELIPLGYSNLEAPIMVLMWVLFFQNIFFILIKSSQRRLRSDLKSLIACDNKSAFFRTTILSFFGSVFWFIAYGAGKVIYVKALGQVELLLAIMISHFFLKEKFDIFEASGVALTAFGVLVLILTQL